MEQNPESLTQIRVIAIISDVTMVNLMEMDRSGAYWGVITEHFPESEWNRVSRVMNFVEVECAPELIDPEGIVTFSWDNIKKLVFRQGLVLDRRALEPENVQSAQVGNNVRRFPKKKFWFFKGPEDCGCGK